MSQRKLLAKLVPSSPSQQQVSIIDLLPQLLDVPGLSQDFLSEYIVKEKLDSESVDTYFDVTNINRQVMIEYLLLYIKYRFPEEVGYSKAAMNMFKKGIEVVKKTVTNVDELDSETLKRIVKEVIEKIEAANTFKDFYHLIFYVRKKAEEAQGKKTFGKNSLLWATLHSLAGLIIHELIRNCYGFKLKLAALNEMVAQKRQLIHISNTEKFGEDTEAYSLELNTLYFDLSQLCDIDAIHEAMQLNLIPYLKILQGAEYRGQNRVNKAIPTCLQMDFYLLLYCSVYQIKVTHKEFKAFRLEAHTKGLAEAKRLQLEGKSEKRVEEATDRSVSRTKTKLLPVIASSTFDNYSPESPVLPPRASGGTSDAKDTISYGSDEETETVSHRRGLGLFDVNDETELTPAVDVDAAESEEHDETPVTSPMVPRPGAK